MSEPTGSLSIIWIPRPHPVVVSQNLRVKERRECLGFVFLQTILATGAKWNPRSIASG